MTLVRQHNLRAKIWSLRFNWDIHVFFISNVYKHMKAQIWFNFFCSLMNKLDLEKNKYTKERAYPEYQFKLIIIES